MILRFISVCLVFFACIKIEAQNNLSYVFDSEAPPTLTQTLRFTSLPGFPNALFQHGSVNHKGLNQPTISRLSSNGGTIWDLALIENTTYAGGLNSIDAICTDGTSIYGAGQTTRASIGTNREVLKVNPTTGAIIWRSNFATEGINSIKDIFNFNTNSILIHYSTITEEKVVVMNKSNGAITSTLLITPVGFDLLASNSSIFHVFGNTVYHKTISGNSLVIQWSVQFNGTSNLNRIVDLGNEIVVFGRMSGNNEERIHFIDKATGTVTGSVNTGRITTIAMDVHLNNNKLYIAWASTGVDDDTYWYDCLDVATKSFSWQKAHFIADSWNGTGSSVSLAMSSTNQLYVLAEFNSLFSKSVVLRVNPISGDVINSQFLAPAGNPSSIGTFATMGIYSVANNMLVSTRYNQTLKTGTLFVAPTLLRINNQNTTHTVVRKLGGTFQLDSKSTVMLEGPDNKFVVASSEGRYGLLRFYDADNNMIAEKYLRINFNVIPSKIRRLPNGNILLAVISNLQSTDNANAPNLNQGDIVLYEFDWSGNQINSLVRSISSATGGMVLYDLMTDGTHHVLATKSGTNRTLFKTSDWTTWTSFVTNFINDPQSVEQSMLTDFNSTHFLLNGDHTSNSNLQKISKSNLTATNFQVIGASGMGMASVEKVLTTENEDLFYYGGFAAEGFNYARVCMYQPSTSDTLWSRSIIASKFHDIIFNNDSTIIYMLYYASGYKIAAVNATNGTLLWTSTSYQSCSTCSPGCFYVDPITNRIWLSINSTTTADVNGMSNLYEIGTSGVVFSVTLLDNAGVAINAIYDILRTTENGLLYCGSTNQPIFKNTGFTSILYPVASESTADVNNDGVVNSADLNLLIQNLGCTTPACAVYDLNGDGVVSILDVMIVFDEM